MSRWWWGWGDPPGRSERSDLSDRAGLWAFLEARLGPARHLVPPAVAPEQIRLRPCRLPEGVLVSLSAAVGGEHLSSEPWDRISHAYGKGYLDLVRLRRGEIPHPPDAVAFPGAEADVEHLLRIADAERIAVVPFGGGTSVVGGLEADPDRPTLCVDLRRMKRLIEVQPDALRATAEAGIRGPELEAGLNARGVTLGHYPQSFELSTLGGWIATRSAGYASTGYGKVERMVTALRMVTPRGTLATRLVPASASGLDLMWMAVGSEGALGIITQATVRVLPLPERRDYRAFLFRNFDEGLAAVREMMRSGPPPTTIRLSDGPETEASLALRSYRAGWAARVRAWLQAGPGLRYLQARGYRVGVMCLAIVGVEGTGGAVRCGWRPLGRLLRRHGAHPLGAGPARAWRREYFEAPYLRDALLDAGVLVDTLETAASWDLLAPLRSGVAATLDRALRQMGTPPFVGCHLSHAYVTGASLYFTFLARQAAGREAEQWHAAKRAATDAIVAAGGTITHHHGVGLIHRPWMLDEHGQEGLRVMSAVKAALDPNGIMNPGKLLG
jgi:alkyldihydroxyacetonephosphate synthase